MSILFYDGFIDDALEIFWYKKCADLLNCLFWVQKTKVHFEKKAVLCCFFVVVKYESSLLEYLCSIWCYFIMSFDIYIFLKIHMKGFL